MTIAVGLWWDLRPAQTLHRAAALAAELKELGISEVVVEANQQDEKDFKFSLWTIEELSAWNDALSAEGIALGVMFWPRPSAPHAERLAQGIHAVHIALPDTFIELDCEGANWDKPTPKGFGSRHEAGEFLADALAPLRADGVQVSVTVHTGSREFRGNPSIAHLFDAVAIQAYSRFRGGEVGYGWKERYGPGQLQALARKRMDTLDVDDDVELIVGLAAYDQGFPDRSVAEAMQRALNGAIGAGAARVRYWSSKWILGHREIPEVRAFVQDIQAQPKAPTAPWLERGATGSDVRRLQTLLGQAGFSAGNVDGDFGPKTERALIRFQASEGLETDGIAGPKTWAALLEVTTEVPELDAGFPQAHLSERGLRNRAGKRSGPLKERPDALPEDPVDRIWAVQEYLDVESSARYLPEDGSTFCNIYAHDFVFLAGTILAEPDEDGLRRGGVYLPRVWWDKQTLRDIQRGKTPRVDYAETVFEMNANRLYDWLTGTGGAAFGWKTTKDPQAIQDAVDAGALGVICAVRKERSRSGHISVVLPERGNHAAIRNAEGVVTVPLQSQAGTFNMAAFADRPGSQRNAWWKHSRFKDFVFAHVTIR